MISHNLIDPKLIPVWERSCMIDPDSAGCSFFMTRYDDLVGDLDPYNIYGPCFSSSASQKSFLLLASKRFNSKSSSKKITRKTSKLMGADCSYD